MEQRTSLFPVRAAMAGSVAVLAWLALLCWLRPGVVADEQYNFGAAAQIAGGGWPEREFLGMPPTYHAFVALWLRWFGVHLWVMRWLNAGLSIGAIWIFAGIAARLAPAVAGALTVAFSFGPLVLSYAALAYTEPAALLVTLLGLGLLLRGKPVVAAFVLIGGCLIRQSGLAWIPMAALWWWLDEGIPRGAGVRGRFAGGWVLLAGLPVAWLGLAVMGGPEFGGRGGNVAKFNVAQIFVYGLALAIFWLPVWVARWSREWKVTLLPAAMRPRWLAVWMGAIGWLALQYTNLHPWNADPKYLRNLALIGMDWHPLARYAFALIALTVALLVALTIGRLERRRLALLAAVSGLLFLAPHFLVDPRYYQIPMTLLLLTLKLSRGQAAWLAGWSVFLALAFCPHILRFGDASGGIW